MSRLITCRRSVTNAPPALSPSTAPAMSAPLIGEPTPLTEATATASQVPLSSSSLVAAQSVSARRLHRRSRDSEPSVHNSHHLELRMGAPGQWESWAEIPKETKILVRDKLSVNFDFKDLSLEVITYLDETFANWYKNWKSDLHAHFKKWGDPETAPRGLPIRVGRTAGGLRVALQPFYGPKICEIYCWQDCSGVKETSQSFWFEAFFV